MPAAYQEAKQRFLDEGLIIENADGCDFGGEYSFLREGCNDVIIALFLSQFIYYIGEVRYETKKMGFGDGGEERGELLETLLHGELFEQTEDKGKSFAKLMRGKLCLKDSDRDGIIDVPAINMKHLEHLLAHPKFKAVSKSCACMVSVLAIHMFKYSKLYLYKFDAHSDNDSLVHAIAAKEHHDNPDITDLFLIFRGSVTLNDWLHNLRSPLIDVNLRADEKTQKYFLVEQNSYKKIRIEKELHDLLADAIGDTPIRVHEGFLAYLFDGGDREKKKKGVTKSPSTEQVEKLSGTSTKYKNKNLCKYQGIKNDMLLLLNEPKNSVYITGHSLGAALATLTSFFLACDYDVYSPNESFQGFKCISFASPLVGNISFQRAFDVLQEYKKGKRGTPYAEGTVRLRHIRFTNDRDLVPLSPPLLRYRHTAGIHVHLNHFSPWAPACWNSIREKKPHRSILVDEKDLDKENKRRRGLFPPDSAASGLLETALPFYVTLITTMPILLVFLYVFVDVVFLNLPPLDFGNFLEAMPNSVQEPVEAFFVEADEHVNAEYLVYGLWIWWFLLGAWPDTSPARTGLFVAVIPILAMFTMYVMARESYDYVTKYGQSLIMVGCTLLQIVMLPIRRADQVGSAETHGLLQYFTHILSSRDDMSSSKNLINLATKKSQRDGMGEKEPLLSVP